MTNDAFTYTIHGETSIFRYGYTTITKIRNESGNSIYD